MARIVRFDSLGGPLRISAEPPRQPGPSEAQIRAQAIGLNRAENLYRNGHYMYAPARYPSGLGYEVSGVVQAVGAEVSHVRPGDAVGTGPAFSQSDYALYGDLVIAPAYAVVKRPARLTAEEGAAVWMQYVTAYGALVELGNLSSGDTLLLTAATGGLGVAGIQIARRLGAKVVASTRKREKRAFLESLKPDRVVVTSEEDVAAATREVSGPRGPRVILDAVMGPTLPALAELIAPSGIIIAYGALRSDAAAGTPCPLRSMIGKGLTLRGYTLFELTWDPARFAATTPFDPVRYPRAIQLVKSGLADGALQPVIAKVFPFERIAEAHACVESNEQSGGPWLG